MVYYCAMTFARASSLLLAFSLVACGGDETPASDGGAGLPDGGIAPGPSEGCGSVRLTSYEVFAGGWCEFPRDLPVLPAFVREGMTAAIAQPYAGGAFDGPEGEACGECWEITSTTTTEVVMITDLCPNAGNPLCQGSHFHIDLASEAAGVLMAGGLDEGAARRVPCPIDGNVHVLVNDDNISYLRVAFVNHRIAIRTAELRAAGAGAPADAPWIALNHSGGAWEAASDVPLDRGGEGVVFRLTSALGETFTSETLVPAHPESGSTFDLGAQFDDVAAPSGGVCEYVPTGVIYDDSWGGIDMVRWMINPWGEAEMGFFGEVSDGCHDDSASCLRLERFGQFSGVHLFYRGSFATESFSTLRVRMRADMPGEVQIAPSNDGERCLEQRFDVGPDWSEAVIDVTTACAGLPRINAVTIDNPGPRIELTLDDIRFEP